MLKRKFPSKGGTITFVPDLVSKGELFSKVLNVQVPARLNAVWTGVAQQAMNSDVKPAQ